MGTHPTITSEWLLSPTLSDPGNWPGASIPRMAISLTSVLLDRKAVTHIWHGKNQSSHHDRMAQPLHLTMEGTNPLTMLEWLWISALISDMEGTNPLTMTEWINPYIWPTRQNGYGYQHSYLSWKEPILSPWHNGSALTSDHGRNQSSHHDRMAQPLHLTMEGTNPLTMTERLWDSSLSLGGNIDLKNTKLLPEVLELHPSQWLCQ